MPLFKVMTVAFLLFVTPAWAAEDTDYSLMVYAVTVSGGAGIYLGNGLVLSVAHVVGEALVNKPKVAIGGQELIATVVKESAFERLDLALLAIDEQRLPVSLRLRRIALCQDPPWPGENVIVVAPQGTARSRIMSPQLLPAEVRKFDTVISDVEKTGNSGSGVFDAQKKCLLGIMSRKISQVQTQRDSGKKTTHDIAKYFVSASTIARFMPAEYRF
jgi:hypothetical protein